MVHGWQQQAYQEPEYTERTQTAGGLLFGKPGQDEFVAELNSFRIFPLRLFQNYRVYMKFHLQIFKNLMIELHMNKLPDKLFYYF